MTELVSQHSVIVLPPGTDFSVVVGPVDQRRLHGAGEDVVPAWDQQQVLHDTLDRRVRGVERFLAVVVVARDLDLGAAHHDDGRCQRREQQHRHERDDERRAFLVREPCVWSRVMSASPRQVQVSRRHFERDACSRERLSRRPATCRDSSRASVHSAQRRRSDLDAKRHADLAHAQQVRVVLVVAGPTERSVRSASRASALRASRPSSAARAVSDSRPRHTGSSLRQRRFGHLRRIRIAEVAHLHVDQVVDNRRVGRAAVVALQLVGRASR